MNSEPFQLHAASNQHWGKRKEQQRSLNVLLGKQRELERAIELGSFLAFTPGQQARARHVGLGRRATLSEQARSVVSYAVQK